MKRLIAVLILTICTLTLGCGAEIGSSEGMTWLHVHYYRRQEPTPEQTELLKDTIRALPSKIPDFQHFEWGRVENSSSNQTHCVRVTVKDSVKESGVDSEWLHDVYVNLPDELDDVYGAIPSAILVHDATPKARTRIRRQLRRELMFRLSPDSVEPDKIKRIEEAMAALPAEIPEIERLQWGTETSSPVPRHHLLLTFNDASARDACLAAPAYKEFKGLLEQHNVRVYESEYISRSASD